MNLQDAILIIRRNLLPYHQSIFFRNHEDRKKLGRLIKALEFLLYHEALLGDEQKQKILEDLYDLLKKLYVDFDREPPEDFKRITTDEVNSQLIQIASWFNIREPLLILSLTQRRNPEGFEFMKKKHSVLFHPYNVEFARDIHSILQKGYAKEFDYDLEEFKRVAGIYAKLTKQKLVYLFSLKFESSNIVLMHICYNVHRRIFVRFITKAFMPRGAEKSKDELFVSKLFYLLNINSVLIDTLPIGKDGMSFLMMEYKEGHDCHFISRIKEYDLIERFIYFLGFACISGAIANLNDRYINIRVDLERLRKLRRKNFSKLKKEASPVYNIDYSIDESDFDFFSNINRFSFGTHGTYECSGLANIPNQIVKENLDHLGELFALGIMDKFKMIKEEYKKKQREIDNLLIANNKTFLRERFSIDPGHLETFIREKVAESNKIYLEFLERQSNPIQTN
ncbi:hypothetical protein D6745_01685 [Candidatus Woesearchaeota archaeon]|nr:MAG: hypothetical protein D6745_01685 [Candidatus Woesearchaeota archaeon]